MKEKIETFKIIWKNPRYHAMIELGLFFLFFFGIFLFVKFSPTSERTTYKSPLEQFRDKNNYAFKIEITDEIIQGEFINNVITFDYQDINYVYEEEIVNPTNFPYSNILKYIDSKYIYNLIVNKDIYSKTEYNDGSISKLYKLEDLDIEVYEQNSQINQIKIITEDITFKIIYLS